MGVRKILQIASLLALSIGARAQFIGYVSPQTVQQTLATAVSCTGTPQVFVVNNLGQTQHYLQVSGLSATKTFTAQLTGVDTAGNFYPISDLAMPGTTGTLVVRGSGYWPKVQASITCALGGTFTASYSGAWATTDVAAGSYLTAQIDKVLWIGVAENANQSAQLQTPFGTGGGEIALVYSAGGAGGSLTVTCQGTVVNYPLATFSLANTTNVQMFQVPDGPCQTISVAYANNGTPGTTNAEYIFSQPGRVSGTATLYKNITTNANTQVKTGPGFLHVVAVSNAGSAETLSFFDGASCAGTSIGATGTVTAGTLIYDVQFFTGLCVTSAGTTPGNFTVSYQ